MKQFFYLFFIVLVDEHWLTLLLLLNLDLCIFGNKGCRLYFTSHFYHFVFIFLHSYAEHSCEDIGSSLDKLRVNGVFQVELKRGWDSLEPTPERLFGLLQDVIGRKCSKQLFDLMIEDVLKYVNS